MFISREEGTNCSQLLQSREHVFQFRNEILRSLVFRTTSEDKILVVAATLHLFFGFRDLPAPTRQELRLQRQQQGREAIARQEVCPEGGVSPGVSPDHGHEGIAERRNLIGGNRATALHDCCGLQSFFQPVRNTDDLVYSPREPGPQRVQDVHVLLGREENILYLRSLLYHPCLLLLFPAFLCFALSSLFLRTSTLILDLSEDPGQPFQLTGEKSLRTSFCRRELVPQVEQHRAENSQRFAQQRLFLCKGTAVLGTRRTARTFFCGTSQKRRHLRVHLRHFDLDQSLQRGKIFHSAPRPLFRAQQTIKRVACFVRTPKKFLKLPRLFCQ